MNEGWSLGGARSLPGDLDAEILVSDEALDWGRSQLLGRDRFWSEGDRDEAAETGLSGGTAKPVSTPLPASPTGARQLRKRAPANLSRQNTIVEVALIQ